ncbi:MAG: HAD family phosphatase [Acidisphaera sp.]|nr:HAD family phosphatase [Acidisphaera sp.]MBV9812404.1 HAD family phosphatase [Acetobacteraceae bacterium]
MPRDRTPSEKIALVLADVDGTLVTHDKVLTERAKAAVHALHERGIAFAITSGRPPKGMAMLVQPLQLEGVIAGFNGGQYADPNLTIVEEHTLDQDAARKAAEVIEKLGLDLWVYAGEDWLVRNPDAPHVAREQWTVKFPPKVVANFDDVMNRVVKLVGVSDDHDLVARAERETQGSLGDHASAARSQPYYLDVTHPNANKGDVVGYLSKRMQISPDAICTIGDMPNDTLMFRRSGLAIAMGQASDDVKKEADVVTASSEEEGFALALEQHVLRTEQAR